MSSLLLLAAILSWSLAEVREDFDALTELSISNLLAKKKHLLRGPNPVSQPLRGNSSWINPIEKMQIKGPRRSNNRKTFNEDWDDVLDDDWYPKKSNSKFGKIFEVTVTTLTFLAFGGYLLCLCVMVMRQRNTNSLAAMSAKVTPEMQIMNNKSNPVWIPSTALTVQSGRRRRRASASPYSYYELFMSPRTSYLQKIRQ